MKRIFLIRHAKSSWEEPWLSDHDRPLAPRGFKAAPEMGKRLKKLNIFPDRIISSTAKRALDTAYLISGKLNYPKEAVQANPDLYHAPPAKYLELIRSMAPQINTVFVVGHNPGMTLLINQLGLDLDNLPTAGICGFKLQEDDWKHLHRENLKFIFLDFPKRKV